MNGDQPLKTGRTCPSCGALLAVDAPAGLCAACLLREGLATETAAGGEKPPFTPPPPAELARHFPQLEILELVGRGGMGAVYKARQPALDRLVALKILPPAKTQEPGFGERFNREARALARLSHPNVVAVHDFGQAGGYPYLVMEFVDGVNLRHLERAGRLSPRDALAIVPQVCDALQYAHDEGVVHRDIKPENILIDRRGRVKIADFGLARLLGVGPANARLTGEGQVMGTPHYMAPEQVEHPREVDHRADIFSLGVVFYELLTGELPLGKFPPPSRKVQIDVRLDDVVLRALEKEPARRYQQAGEVKTEVESIARTTPPCAAAPAMAEHPRRWWAPLALGLFLLGTLGTLLLMTVSYRHELALIFGGLALMLALVFGCLSWRERLSKGVVLATALIFIAGGLTVAILTGVALPGAKLQRLRLQQQVDEQLSAKVAAELASWLPRLKAGNLEERRQAALRLHSAGPRAEFAVPDLIAALRDEDWQVRMLAAATLGYIGEPAGTQAVAALRGRLLDPDQRVGFNAALALTKVAPDDQSGIPLLMDTLTNRPAGDRFGIWQVQRREATEALEKLGFRDLPGLPATKETREQAEASPSGPAGPEPDFPIAPAAAPAPSAQPVPPVVIATVPESGAAAVDPALAEIRVRFSEPMRDRSWSWGAWSEASFPETAGRPRYLPDGRTCVLPVRLQPGKCYAVWVNMNTENAHEFADRDGQPAVPYLLVFRTGK